MFTSEMGLSFAIAFTAYDNETEDILDASYGKLVFTTYEWGEDEAGNPFLSYDEIPSHTCSREELGLVEDSENASLFFPVAEKKQNLLNMYQKKFKCINREDMHVNGDFDSDYARLISMRLVRCTEAAGT